MNLFSPLADGTRRLMENLPELIEKTFPLPRRFSHALPRDVAELSELFTSRREEKDASYLGRPNLLSAYLRYFLPWNVYRLCRLLPALPLELEEGSVVTDLGSGPLSLALALWISRPELRGLRLEFRCIDRTQAVLDAGRKLFEALVQSHGAVREGEKAWTVKTIRGEIRNNGTLSVKLRGNPSSLVCAANVYNEIFWKFSPADKGALQNLAAQSGALMNSLCADNGMILTVEPGIPRSGEFISAMRSVFLEQGLCLLSPCPHSGGCPYPGGGSGGKGKAKWCHFSFDTSGAPEKLKRVSAAAGIPKDRAVISFLLAGKHGRASDEKKEAMSPEENGTRARIISDAFSVGDRYGRYGCSSLGAVLALGSREQAGFFDSGSLAELKMSRERDSKSGALKGDFPGVDTRAAVKAPPGGAKFHKNSPSKKT